MMIGQMNEIEKGIFFTDIKRFLITLYRAVCQKGAQPRQGQAHPKAVVDLQPILVEVTHALSRLLNIK